MSAVCRAGAEAGEATAAILATLPEWFGRPAANRAYAKAAATHPGFVAHEADAPAGVLILTSIPTRQPTSISSRWLGSGTGRGHGRRLVAVAARHAREAGQRFLTVQTLGPSARDTVYAGTRAFWRARGFAPLMEFPDRRGSGEPDAVDGARARR